MCIIKTLGTGVLLYFAFLMTVAAQGSSEAKVTKADGLLRAVFKTQKGNINVLLPDDMRSGDMISGTVLAEPTGNNPSTVDKNKGVLNGYVIEMQGKKTPAGKGSETWSLPSTGSVSNIVLTLLDQSGKRIAFTQLPVDPLPRILNTDMYPVSSTIIPRYMQAGTPTVIRGNFDGSFANSKAALNDKSVQLLAESPGQVVIRSPEGITGLCNLELTEGPNTTRQKINVLDVKLTAIKTNLIRNESSTINLEVIGLGRVTEPVTISITNFSPGNVSLLGGDQQTLFIQPSEVSGTGTWSKDLTLTGITTGAFSIQAKIAPPGNDAVMVNPAITLKPLSMPEYIQPLIIDPVYQASLTEFAKDAGLMFNITDFNLPKKYEFDPERQTVAKSSKKDFDEKRKGANAEASATKTRTDSTVVQNRKELKGTVGFRVYYTKADEYNCYWIISEWFSWKSEEYYRNSWKLNRELDDVLRFNNIQVDINGNIEMEGSVETGGLDASAEIGIGIPIPGVDAGVSVSYSPPSTAALKAKGTLKGAAKGYLNGKTMVVYIYKDTYHVERAWISYFYRYKQKYCNDKPVGAIIYETTMVDQWEKYTEIKYFADAFLVTEGIPVGPDSVHHRVETLVESKHVDTDIKDWKKTEPKADQDPSGFFEGVIN